MAITLDFFFSFTPSQVYKEDRMQPSAVSNEVNRNQFSLISLHALSMLKCCVLKAFKQRNTSKHRINSERQKKGRGKTE
jgi:hypothetical protein